MPKFVSGIKVGSTSVTLPVLIRSKTDNTELTGLAFNTAGNVASYQREGATRTAITLATQTVAGAWSSGGFVEVDATNMPGLYRLDVPDAAFASGAEWVVVSLKTTSGYTFYERFELSDNIVASVSGSVGSVTGAVASVTGSVTVGTNNDKTGYTLSGAGVQAIWDALTTALTTANSVGKKIADWVLGSDNRALISANVHTAGATVAAVTGAVGSVTGNVGGNVTGSVGSVTGAVGSVTGAVGSVTGSVGSVTGAVTLDFTTALPGSPTAGTTGAALVKANSLPFGVRKNTALDNFQLFMTDSSDHVSGKTGLTVSGQRSIDGGAFSALTNTVAEIGNGVYKVNLTAAELNGTVITLRFTATGADPRVVTIITEG